MAAKCTFFVLFYLSSLYRLPFSPPFPVLFLCFFSFYIFQFSSSLLVFSYPCSPYSLHSLLFSQSLFLFLSSIPLFVSYFISFCLSIFISVLVPLSNFLSHYLSFFVYHLYISHRSLTLHFSVSHSSSLSLCFFLHLFLSGKETKPNTNQSIHLCSYIKTITKDNRIQFFLFKQVKPKLQFQISAYE